MNTKMIIYPLALLLSSTLLITGTLAVYMGYSFYSNNKKSESARNLFWISVCVAVWECGYGIMSETYNQTAAAVLRGIALAGVYVFIPLVLNYIVIISDLHDKNLKTGKFLIIFFGILSYLLLQSPDDEHFETCAYGYYYMGRMNISRIVQMIYLILCVILIFKLCSIWKSHAVYKRTVRLIKYTRIFGAIILLGSMFDTIIPVICGTQAFPSSAIGAFISFVILLNISKNYELTVLSDDNIAKYIMVSVDTPVLILKNNFTIVGANEAACKFIKIPEKEIIGKKANEFFNISITPSEGFIRSIGSNKTYTDDISLKISNTPCRAVTTTVFDSFKDPICGITFIYDATNEVRIMSELFESKIAADNANKEKSQFLANMSHEIRTPMNAIIGMSEIALRDELPPKQKECIRQIQSSGRWLLTIINDILDFSKIESGNLEIMPMEYEVLSMLNDVVNMSKNKVEEKNLTYVINVNPHLPSKLYGDEGRIKQVLLNIINNAAKYTDSGYVELSVDFKREAVGVTLMISVKDTGIGIKEEAKEKLFQSFSRLDTYKNRAIEGTGLGLAITKQLLKLMDGEISFDSTYGVGSTFRINIKQGIVDDTVCMSVKEKDTKCIAGMYTLPVKEEAFKKFAVSLGLSCTICQNKTDIEKFAIRNEKQKYLFIEPECMDADTENYLKGNTDIHTVYVVPYDYNNASNKFITIYRPTFGATLVSILNNENAEVYNDTQSTSYIRFAAPTAKILIVDDNNVNILVAVGLLKPFMMNIDTVTGGEAAVHAVEENDYDVVFMDHMMPDVDGIEATRRIRNLPDPKYKRLPIIALTANALSGVSDIFVKAGMNDFVAKPIEMRDISSKLRKWLPASKIQEKANENDNVPIINSAEKIKIMSLPVGLIDTKIGVSFIGNDYSMYADVLFEFAKQEIENARLFNDYLSKGDIYNYTIKVHALKSAARNIGAIKLSEKAAELEKAGKEENISFISKENGSLLDMYHDTVLSLSDIASYVKEKKERANMGRAQTFDDNGLFVQVSEFKKYVDDYDLENAERIINMLRVSDFNKAYMDDVESAFSAIDNIDYESASNAADSIIKKLKNMNSQY